MTELPQVPQELIDDSRSGSESDRCRAIVASALSDAFSTESVLEFLLADISGESDALLRARVVAFAHLVRLRGTEQTFRGQLDGIASFYRRTREVGPWGDVLDDASVFAPGVLQLLREDVGVSPG